MFARTERLLLRPGWREDAPALQLLVTWNAAVNDSMLAVNKRLGYGDRERWIEAELVVG